jgi:hypothetical protein
MIYLFSVLLVMQGATFILLGYLVSAVRELENDIIAILKSKRNL